MEFGYIILSAGKSSRIYNNIKKHKSLIKVNGKTLLEHHIDGAKILGAKSIYLVIGWYKDEILTYLNKKDINSNLQIIEGCLECKKYGGSLYNALKKVRENYVFWVCVDHYINYIKLSKLINIKELINKRKDLVIFVDSNPLLALPHSHMKGIVCNNNITFDKSLQRWDFICMGLFFGKKTKILEIFEKLNNKEYDTEELSKYLNFIIFDVQGKVEWFGINTYEELIKLKQKGIKIEI